MNVRQANLLSAKVLVVLSLVALLSVLSGYVQRPELDEGAAAHIFQLSIIALVPAIVVFLATADWRNALRRVARPLAIPSAALAFAFAALYYIEHYR